jgi:autotransporter-associated beta strand protein
MKNSQKHHFLDTDFSGFLSCLSKLSLRNLGLLSLTVTMMLLSGTAHAQWLTGYHYRKSLAINAGVGSGTGYQIQVRVGESSGSSSYDLHLDGKALNFPNDVRFTDNDGTTSLGHWLESTTGSAPNRTVTFLVKVNDDLDSSQSIFTYYRKSGEVSGSDGNATFSFFDDFTGGVIDPAKWIIDNSTGWSIANGELRGQNTVGRIRSQTAFSAGVILESKYRSLIRPFNGFAPLGFYASRTNSYGWHSGYGGDASWINGNATNLGNECNAAVIGRITARTNQVDLYVYRQDNGAVWHDLPNQNMTVSNLQIRLGTRYDNNYNGAPPGQAYDSYWDWVRVRKYSANVPTMGTVGAEQADAPTVTLVTPANGSQVGIGASPTATATVYGGAQPCSVQFFLNGSPVGTDNSEPYSFNLGALGAGTHTISATVTDALTPTARTANSATHTITVATDSTPPTPSPMTFLVAPVSISPTSIRMAATTATDVASSPVEYYFENTTNSNNSGWQFSQYWTDSSLTTGLPYSYRVKARDSSAAQNETAWSAPLSATPSDIVPRAVTIVNPGFENPFLTDNDSTGVFIGWKTIGGTYAWNPPTSSYTQEAPEGRNIGTIFLASAFSGCSQVLQGAQGQFQADTSYDLKVRVGGGSNFSGIPLAYDGYLIQLVVNGTIIAQDDNSRVPADGSFLTTSIKYNYNAAMHSSLVGYPMEIRLLNKGFGAGSGIVSFDDVQLTYASSGPLANHGGPYSVNQNGSVSLNGSASIASPGAAITTHEWDLDSRNDNLGFIVNASGPTPSSLSYATLTSAYGMAQGTNTFRLRVTDTAGQSAISVGTVTIFTLATYIGPNNASGTNDSWNKPNNWSTGSIPTGLVDVVVPDSQSIPCQPYSNPPYTGNMNLGANSQLSFGWAVGTESVHNPMGTPGSTVITMNPGSSFSFRLNVTRYVPAIVLAGNASMILGSSTGTAAPTHFNYPITGNFRLSFYGNGHGTCQANLNAPNTFTELYAGEIPYSGNGVTLLGNSPGAFGTGNITLPALANGNNSGIIIINAENAMADSAILSMSGNNATKITMNANDTIASLVINGAQMPAGTYGSSSSAATFKQTWMAGTGILTVAQGQGNVWDINGATAGAGGANPSGTWDSGTANWSNSTTGVAATASWVGGRTAVFAAGSDATGDYTVTVGDSNAISITNVKATVTGNSGTTNMNVTESNWALSGGNAVVVLFSGKNVSAFSATYAGVPMTVASFKDANNVYNGIAYLIDPVASTGNIVMTGTYGFINSNNVLRYAYRVLSLSNVASVGTPQSRNSVGTLTYSTSVNNSYVFGVASNNTWQNSPATATGNVSNVFYSGNPGYYNTLMVHGPVISAGSSTDSYNGNVTGAITLTFNAKTTANPALSGSGQKIAGLTFEEGAVTITGNKLELQSNSPFTSSLGVSGTISSQITGLTNAGMIKKGAGTVVLANNTNSYTGSTTIQNGTLRLGASNALPNTAIILSSDASGVTPVLNLNGFSNTVAGITFGGSSATSGSTITGSGTLSLSGNVTFNSDNSPLGATIASSLDLGASTRSFNIKDSYSAANDLTVSTAVSGSGTAGITKIGFGTLLLSGNNTYPGLTTASAGLLILSGDNTLATGNISVGNGGAVRFDTLNSINGSGQNVTIQSGGLVSFGPSFGSGNVISALARINASSTGVIAVDNVSSSNFNLSTNSLNAYIGALNDITYNGSITPFGGTYRIGGGTGTITLSGASSLLGGNNLVIGGSVIIANNYNLGSGTTTIDPSGRLQIGAGGTVGLITSASLINNGMLAFNRSDTLTQSTQLWTTISGTGALEQAGSGTVVLNGNNTYSGGTNLVSGTLRLGHTNAIGSGRLNIYSGILDANSNLTLATNNAVTVVSSFTFGGSANLNMGTAIVSNTGNHTIQLNGSSNLTFGGMTNISNEDQILTVDGVGKTLYLGRYDMSNNRDSYLMELTIGGTGNVAITGPVNDWTGGDPDIDPYDPQDIRLGNLIKTGPGTLTLSGNNNYTGDTVVEEGVLHLASGTQMSPIIVEGGGTLAFTLDSPITSTKGLTLDFGHKIRIVGTPDNRPYYILMTANSIVGGTPTLETPITLPTNYYLEIAGNELRLSKADTTSPLLVDIINDQGGGASVGPIIPGTLVTYTVSFNEDIKDGDVDASDFSNAGTIPIGNITFGNIIEISPGVFSVEVTPTVAGTLKLRIPVAAVINDAANNALDNNPALDDDTTINVASPSNNWLLRTDIVDDKAGSDISIGELVTYTLYFDRDIDHTTVTSIDFVNAGATVTIGTITETAPGTFTVQVTPTTTGTLQLSIPTTAEIKDQSGLNTLDNDPAISDDTTINVISIFDSWAGTGNDFVEDLNADGIANGLAWLLGANNPNEDARDLLPLADQTNGDLTLVFNTLNAVERGNASIKVQYSNDLGITDLWTNNEAEVPGTPGIPTDPGYTVNGIKFNISDAGNGLLYVEATIDETEAGVGKKLFARVKGTAP